MFVELPRVRLDGGARAFRQHWGYETRPLAPPPPLIEEDEAAVEPETVSLREANTASPIGEYPPNLPRYRDAFPDNTGRHVRRFRSAMFFEIVFGDVAR
jgi:hypothetical protein